MGKKINKRPKCTTKPTWPIKRSALGPMKKKIRKKKKGKEKGGDVRKREEEREKG